LCISLHSPKTREKYKIFLNQARGNPARNSIEISLGHKSKALPPSYPNPPNPFLIQGSTKIRMLSLQFLTHVTAKTLGSVWPNMYCAVLITNKYCCTPTLVKAASSNDTIFINCEPKQTITFP
jgi:hypothetical protein